MAAHPDDEILGCGGVVARLVSEGNSAYTLVLGEGITSRDGKRDKTSRKILKSWEDKCIGLMKL